METMKLVNKSRNLELADDVRVAQSFWSRTKGLIGQSSLPRGSSLWIQGTRFIACNSIHTWFMSFPIDAIFVDRKLRVKAVYRNLAPWRVTWPTAGAHSVFEMAAGALTESNVEIGDQLHVGN
jgi:uncharacterized protein